MDKSENDDIKNLIDFGDDGSISNSSGKEASPDIDSMPDNRGVSDNSGGNDNNSIPDDSGINADSCMIDNSSDADSAPVIDDTPDGAADTDIEVVSGISDTDDSEEANDEADTPEDDLPYITEVKKSKPQKKKLSKRARIIKWTAIFVLAAAFVTIFTITDTGIIGAYKRNFAHNFAKIFHLQEKPREAAEEDDTRDASVYIAPNEKIKTHIYSTSIKNSIIIPYDYAAESEYSAYSKGIVCAATNYMCYINSSGVTEWECATTVIDPILRTAGNYILIAQKNGTKLCLYNGSTLLYDTDCEDDILNADLSENGDCVLVTTKDLYKGAICAYNKSGKLIYARSSGDGSVIDAAISPKSRNIAAALLNTDDTVRSTIEIFDIMKSEPERSLEFDDTIMFDVEYFGNSLNIFGDNCIAGLKPDGEEMFNYRFEDSDITHYAYDNSGNKLILFETANVPSLSTYNLKGKQISSAEVPALSDFLSICGSQIMYNMDREIITGKSNGKKLLKYTASMDIRDLIMVNKNMFFIVYSNSIELVRK